MTRLQRHLCLGYVLSALAGVGLLLFPVDERLAQVLLVVKGAVLALWFALVLLRGHRWPWWVVVGTGAAVVIVSILVPGYWGWLLPLPLVVSGALWGLFHLALWPQVGRWVVGLLVLAAVGVPVAELQDPATRYNIVMVLALSGFIVGAAAVASTYTFLFIKTFEKLDRDPVGSMATQLPLLVPPFYLVLEFLWGTELFGAGSLRTLAVGYAQDIVLAGGATVLVLLRFAGRRIGTNSFVASVAWKFLRSQRMVPTFRSRRVQALRAMVGSLVPSPSQGEVRLVVSLAVVFVVGWVVSAEVVPASWRGMAGLVWTGLWTSVFASRSLRSVQSHWWASAGVGLLMALYMIVQLRRLDVLAHQEWLSLGLQCGVGVIAAMLLTQGGVRWLLAGRHQRGQLSASLDPALAPPEVHHIKEGVGASMFVSVVGVAVGVWALIVVLSVMSGFSGDLQSRMSSTKDHITVTASDEVANAGHMLRLADRIQSLTWVRSASCYVQGDVMMATSLNISSTVELRGVDPWGSGLHFIEPLLVEGGIELFQRPEALVELSASEQKRTPDLWTEESPPEAMDKAEEETLDDEAGAEEGLMEMPDLGLDDDLAEGDIVAATDVDGLAVYPTILIGQELSRALGVSVGSTLTVIAPDGDIGPMGVQPKARSFMVAGVFSTGMYDFDLKLAFVALTEAQRFLGLGGRVDYIDVRLSRLEQVEGVRASILALDEADETSVTTWQEKNRSLFSAMRLERLVMFVVLGFIILIASFNIVSSLIILIRRRTGAIAILKTMGATSREVVGIFLVLGVAAGVFGTVSGIMMGLSTCGIIEYVGIALPRQYYIRSLPVLVDPWQVLWVALAAVSMTSLAALYPGKLASRVAVVEGLKDERQI